MFEFKPIVFAKLPKDFLEFAEKPFDFPIEKTSILSVYNILDYNYLIKKFDDFASDDEMNHKNEDDDLKSKLEMFNNPNIFTKYASKNYPTVLLLVGNDASGVIVVDKINVILLKPFYVDKFGCPDIGFRRGRPLTLNEEKYGRTMDMILSGDFSFYINNSTR